MPLVSHLSKFMFSLSVRCFKTLCASHGCIARRLAPIVLPVAPQFTSLTPGLAGGPAQDRSLRLTRIATRFTSCFAEALKYLVGDAQKQRAARK